MDRPISAFLGYGLVFGAIFLVVGIAYYRHVRLMRDLERERHARDGASR